MQSLNHRLTTNIPTHLSNRIDTGQQDDSDYQDDRDEELYQVDGTTEVPTPTDNSDNNEEDEPDNNEMTKKRQADILKKQHEKDKVKAQVAANKDEPDNTNRPRSHRSKGKASHSDKIKSTNKGRRTAR